MALGIRSGSLPAAVSNALLRPRTPPVDPARRALSRRTRLRWLAGQRLDHDAWDAFEAVDGVPLSDASQARRDWADVRWWLLDVAGECAARAHGDRARTMLQRVWVLASGRAKWLDDPVADAGAREDLMATDQQLLIAIARTALQDEADAETPRPGSRDPLPLGARQFLDRLYHPRGRRHPRSSARARGARQDSAQFSLEAGEPCHSSCAQ